MDRMPTIVEILPSFVAPTEAEPLILDKFTGAAGLFRRAITGAEISDNPHFRSCACGLGGFNARMLVRVGDVELRTPYLLTHLTAHHRAAAIKAEPGLLATLTLTRHIILTARPELAGAT